MSKAVTIKVPGEENLTPRQRAFCNHPLVLSDPAAAARAVGYSDSFCASRVYQLRKELLFYIEKKSTPVLERAEVTRAEVMSELAAIAMSNVMDCFELVDTLSGGSQLALKENVKVLPIHIQKAIRKIDFDTVVGLDGKTVHTVVSHLEMHNKLGALQELVDILRMKQGPTGESKRNKVLDSMPANKLSELRTILEDAAAQVAAAENKERDRDALESN